MREPSGMPADPEVVLNIRKHWLIVAAALIGPLLALAVTWLPLIAEYRVAEYVVTDPALAGLRRSPADATLTELQRMNYGLRRLEGRSRIIGTADALIGGVLTLDGYEALAVGTAPNLADLERGPATMQLKMASMLVPDLLLQAYSETGERHYFDHTISATLGWARMEKATWIPVGLLWNDHAVASRVLYLARFWQHYRVDEMFDAEIAGEILGFVSRSAEHLARAQRYTYRTNHGIMQNLGLLHVAAAFPELPRRQDYLNLALARLDRHLPYFVSPEGIILEHSGSYQEFGVELLHYLGRYLQILELDQPDAWATRSANSFCFLRRIVRPDGTYPFYGDSFGSLAIPLVSDAVLSGSPLLNADCSGNRFLMSEDFGYASHRAPAFASPPDWKEAVSHTFVAWANFVGGSHKHADEPSVFAWYAGQDWWAASGYWPFGDPARASAVSWEGSNAPHFAGEPAETPRVTSLLKHAVSDALLFLDLERVSDRGRFRRQFAHVAPDVWVVLDSDTVAASSRQDSIRTLWTTGPDVSVSPRDARDLFKLTSQGSPASLDVAFIGADGTSVALSTGSREPFMGMVVDGRKLVASNVLVVESSPNSWHGTVWVGNPDGTVHLLRQQPAMNWSAPDDWELSFRLPAREFRITRRHGRLELGDGDAVKAVDLVEGRAELNQLARATDLLMSNAEEYGGFSDYLSARKKVSSVLLALALIYWLVVVVAARLGSKRMGDFLSAIGLFGWVVLSCWLFMGYWS